MKDRILKLCKRLDKFSFEEIVGIAEDVDESVMKLLLQTYTSRYRVSFLCIINLWETQFIVRIVI